MLNVYIEIFFVNAKYYYKLHSSFSQYNFFIKLIILPF